MPVDSPERESFKILNPLGEDTSIMRTTTLPSMLEILTRNYNFRNKEVRLYELGRTYHLGGKDGLAIEKKYLTLGTYGAKVNFFTVKGLVEAIMKDLRAENVRFEACTDNPSYHPGRCASVWAGDECIGVFGQIHPLVAANYGVDTELYCAELSLEKLLNAYNAAANSEELRQYLTDAEKAKADAIKARLDNLCRSPPPSRVISQLFAISLFPLLSSLTA